MMTDNEIRTWAEEQHARREAARRESEIANSHVYPGGQAVVGVVGAPEGDHLKVEGQAGLDLLGLVQPPIKLEDCLPSPLDILKELNLLQGHQGLGAYSSSL
jgi:hypothetical protein